MIFKGLSFHKSVQSIVWKIMWKSAAQNHLEMIWSMIIEVIQSEIYISDNITENLLTF